ncbi:MAG: hypothetical protein JXP73_07120 [Deltaproteobacteria bacterium]|jgi:hypothetical protein|nr:hypothetical protein [Deltaproteobacteria bacterium]
MLLLRAVSPGISRHGQVRRSSGRLALALLAFALALGASPSVDARPRKAKAHTKSGPRGKSARKWPAQGAGRATTTEASLAAAKVAVLPFEGEEPEQLRKHVIKLLVDRGLQVDSTLEPQDSAIQYRDMGAALNLAVYVHGKMKPTTGDRAVATVTIRSAVTGRPVATATFNGYKRGLPFDVEEKLWDRVGPAFRRACLEARKPNRRHSKPMHIEAGTPL